ncbi:unnamed protein product [Cochlearia groenlandica]
MSLDYEWDMNPYEADHRNMHIQDSDPTRSACLSIFDHNHHHHHHNHNNNISPAASSLPLLSSFSNQQHLTTVVYVSGSASSPSHTNTNNNYNFLIPKPEVDVVSRPLDFTSNRIGLNLGGRTYFSAADDDFVSRLYRRSRPGEWGMGNAVTTPRCQAEGCNADLNHAKHYHRRHKVCEFHSKASTVVAAGLSQRFCQQCSRFHLLSEFDNGKRSCRKRLADHNRRRRKCHQTASNDNNAKSNLDISTTTPMNELGGIKSLSSSPTISLECFRQTTAASSSTSSPNSMFF